MKRSLVIVLGTAVATFGLFVAAYFIAHRVCTSQMAGAGDDLDWLRREFRLSDAELARVRQLHEGYMPRCEAMCKEIADKKREVEAALAATTNLTDVSNPAGRKLAELALLRAQCQLTMLQHFVEVSQAMPPEQGRRYLAEMQRLTLGFHEQIEQTMSDSAGHAHGHN